MLTLLSIFSLFGIQKPPVITTPSFSTTIGTFTGSLCVGGTTAGLPNHLPEFPFLGEFLVQQGKVMDQVPARLNECGTRGDGAVGLDAEYEFSVLKRQQRLNGRDD